MGAGSVFAFRFVAAGTYRVVDRPSGARGTVAVPLDAVPAGGPSGTGTHPEFSRDVYRIEWAAGQVSDPFAFTVEIKRPSARFFATWENATGSPWANFIPGRRARHLYVPGQDDERPNRRSVWLVATAVDQSEVRATVSPRPLSAP